MSSTKKSAKATETKTTEPTKEATVSSKKTAKKATEKKTAKIEIEETAIEATEPVTEAPAPTEPTEGWTKRQCVDGGIRPRRVVTCDLHAGAFKISSVYADDETGAMVVDMVSKKNGAVVTAIDASLLTPRTAGDAFRELLKAGEVLEPAQA